MKKAAEHKDEVRRLEALKDLRILDTLPEKDYDDLTTLAAEICDAPIALISLIDSNRQWFKSKFGIDAVETPRDVAFCSHAILQNEIFVIDDATKDERFHDNPFVTGDANIRFYAGVPLKSPHTEMPVGTLCVIDTKPRKLNERQTKAMTALANQIVRLFDLRLQITEREKINHLLEINHKAIQTLSEGIVIRNQNGELIDCNPAAVEILSLHKDELKYAAKPAKIKKIINEDGTDTLPEHYPSTEALNTGQPVLNRVLGLVDENQNIKWLICNSAPIYFDGHHKPDFTVTTFLDITERKNTQAYLFQNAKMTSLGEMAAGIAHEINNPLAIICTAAHQLRDKINQPDTDKDYIHKKLESIENTGYRIAHIIKGLRKFARDSKQDPWELYPLDQIISDTLSLCRERFSQNGVSIDIECTPGIAIDCVPTQASQVLLNLLNNAFDAMMPLSEKWIKVKTELVENSRIKIQVIDSGKGIAQSIEDKIMQPFFTTKPVNKGMGLGLSISKGIVETFKGQLTYENLNGNTCFTITWPYTKLN